VVVHLDLDASLLHLQDQLAAELLQAVRRRDREVPFLVPGLVARLGFSSRPLFQMP